MYMYNITYIYVCAYMYICTHRAYTYLQACNPACMYTTFFANVKIDHQCCVFFSVLFVGFLV